MTLIGYWPLNETEGDTAYDYSGNENHGSLEGSPTQGVKGVVGSNSYGFNGDDDKIVTSYKHDANKGTLTFWGYTTSTSAQYLGHDSENDDRFYVGTNSGSDIQGGFGDNFEDFGTIIETDKWVMFTIVADGSEAKLYANNKFAGKFSYNQNLAEDNFTIGDLEEGGYNWEGRLSSVRVYNRPLTSSEVQYLYNVSRRGSFSSRKKRP